MSDLKCATIDLWDFSGLGTMLTTQVVPASVWSHLRGQPVFLRVLLVFLIAYGVADTGADTGAIKAWLPDPHVGEPADKGSSPSAYRTGLALSHTPRPVIAREAFP
jgi:hypothetical protein